MFSYGTNDTIKFELKFLSSENLLEQNTIFVLLTGLRFTTSFYDVLYLCQIILHRFVDTFDTFDT